MKTRVKSWIPEAGELTENWQFRKYLDSHKENFPNEFASLDYESSRIEDISGNINWVKRVNVPDTTNNTTLVVKHVPLDGRLSRFPSIRFSPSRLDFDHAWLLHATGALKDTKHLRVPMIYDFDPELRLLVMEDLGTTSLSETLTRSMSGHYESPQEPSKKVPFNLAQGSEEVFSEKCLSNILELAESLGRGMALINSSENSLQSQTQANKTNIPVRNPAARENRPYIFHMHLDQPQFVADIWRARETQTRENSTKTGLPPSHRNFICLEDRLNLQARMLRDLSEDLVPALKRLDANFENCPDPVFTHGDLHTGSLIVDQIKNSIGVIDAELADPGPASFDLGLLTAHLIAELDFDLVPEVADKLVSSYMEELGQGSSNIQKKREAQSRLLEETSLYAGAEILRRLMGPAGFSAPVERDKFEFLFEFSCKLLLDPTKSRKTLFPELEKN